MIFINDECLLSTIKGKKVAIVGPSPHLINKKIGKLIDEYDIVCRVNEVGAFNFEEDYGKRTDIIFHNCGTDHIERFSENLKNNLETTKELKYVVCPCIKAIGADRIEDFSDGQISNVVQNFNNINKFNIPFYWIGIEEYKKVYQSIGVEPNAGFTSVILLLSCLPKELFITGFSFYSQGDLSELSVRPGHSVSEDKLTGNAGHFQAPQIYFFKNFILSRYSSVIKIDSYLNDILSLNHSNILKI